MLPLDDDPNTIYFIAAVAGTLLALGLGWFVLSRRRRSTSGGPAKLLPLDDFCSVPLLRKESLSHDTVRFTFGLPGQDSVLGLPVGQHLTLQFVNGQSNKTVQRSYTPVTDDDTVGQFSLIIKVYRPAPPKFPTGGQMSQHLNGMKIGDTIRVKGPKGHLRYTSAGHFQVKPLGRPVEQRYSAQLGMMAGGTGITPMLQILNYIFKTSSCRHIKAKLLYANQTVDDILVRDELEQLAADYPDRFQLWYTVDRLSTDDNEETTWKYSTGFISKDMIQEQLLFPKNGDHAGGAGAAAGDSRGQQFFMCGPPPMIKYACLPALTELGYSEKDWVVM